MSRVPFRDRERGELLQESHAVERQLQWLYHSAWGRLCLPLVVDWPVVSWLVGLRMTSPRSRALIEPFIRQNAIQTEEFRDPVGSFPHFDAFFSRALKPGARPFPQEPDRLGAPADGKILVFPCLLDDTPLPIKGTLLPLARLVASEDEAKPFIGGSALIIRLAPHDYHRFHFPDSGEAGTCRMIQGRYHSVSPIALSARPNALLLNKRSVTRIQTDHFGPVDYLEVGALTIGRIIQTFAPGRVARGDEKGYFRFGGSTVVMLFEPGRIQFDDDLIRDSAQGLEVQVRAGMPIGRSQHAG